MDTYQGGYEVQKTPVLDKVYPVPTKKLIEWIFGDVGEDLDKPIPFLLKRLKYRCKSLFFSF